MTRPIRMILIVIFCLLIAACGGKAEALKTTYEAYDLSFKLPEGWRDDDKDITFDMHVMGGSGFASSDYAGRTYLRFHQGKGFIVIRDWEPAADVVEILQAAFARDITEPESIKVLGYDGTYAHGKIDQGQAIGAVHVIYEDAGGNPEQIVFIGVIADDWEKFEATFLEIVKSAKLNT